MGRGSANCDRWLSIFYGPALSAYEKLLPLHSQSCHVEWATFFSGLEKFSHEIEEILTFSVNHCIFYLYIYVVCSNFFTCICV